MDRLSPKKKVAVVRDYLSGLSYDEIAAKHGVSKGTVSNVVADLKAGRFPEVGDVINTLNCFGNCPLTSNGRDYPLVSARPASLFSHKSASGVLTQPTSATGL